MAFELKPLKIAAVAGAVALLPMAASATTVFMNTGGSYSLDNNDVYRWDTQDEFSGSVAGESYFFEFTSSTLPQGIDATVTISILGDFTNLQMAWSTDTVFDAGDTFISLHGSTDADFSTSASPIYLLTSYDAVANGGNIDYRISAIPVPAAGLMLLTALGGLGLARRKRKAA